MDILDSQNFQVLIKVAVEIRIWERGKLKGNAECPPFKEETVHLASNEVSEMGETATLGWLIARGRGLGEHI